MNKLIFSIMAMLAAQGMARMPEQPLPEPTQKRPRGNKYGHLTWKESRPENTELRHRNEAERAKQR